MNRRRPPRDPRATTMARVASPVSAVLAVASLVEAHCLGGTESLDWLTMAFAAAALSGVGIATGVVGLLQGAESPWRSFWPIVLGFIVATLTWPVAAIFFDPAAIFFDPSLWHVTTGRL